MQSEWTILCHAILMLVAVTWLLPLPAPRGLASLQPKPAHTSELKCPRSHRGMWRVRHCHRIVPVESICELSEAALGPGVRCAVAAFLGSAAASQLPRPSSYAGAVRSVLQPLMHRLSLFLDNTVAAQPPRPCGYKGAVAYSPQQLAIHSKSFERHCCGAAVVDLGDHILSWWQCLSATLQHCHCRTPAERNAIKAVSFVSAR